MAPSTENVVTFPALDSLRFVGALGVVVTHVSFQTGQYGPDVVGTFLARLDSGVALFFVLSGYLLSRPFLSRMAGRRERPHAGYYAWKRLLRIAPVYLVTAASVLILIPPSRGPLWSHWIENLTLTTIYTPRDLPEGLTQMWSLATEVAFYALLPVLMAALARTACARRWRPLLIIGVLALLCAMNVAWLAVVPLDRDTALWLPAFLSWFSAGMALSVISVDLEQSSPCRPSLIIARVRDVPGACVVAAFAILLIASTPVAGPIVADVPTAGEAIVKNALYAAFGLLLVGAGVLGAPSSPTIRALSWTPLRQLGRISYGIFCVHLLVLYGLFQWRSYEYFGGHFWEILVWCLAGSIALSLALHAWIESPAERLRRVGRPKTEAATAPSATATTT